MDITAIRHELENGGFELDKHSYIEAGDDFVDAKAVPYIADPKAWEQYSDDALYDAEKRLRAWLEEMSAVPAFTKHYSARTFKFSQLFEFIYGRRYEQKVDGKYSTMLSRLFRYYCSKTSKTYYVKATGKTQSKTSFTLSVARLKRPPYSLRLRLEWLAAQGIIPTSENMKLPKDIEIGRCRNELTEAHREAQREAGRQRYNEYQRKLRAEHKEGRPVRSYNRRASAADDTVQNDR